ncbi:hypothetical protein A3B87_02425 [Candidatus Kuenenbacteria bacterium RIFCSPHIGHO2_02_FULL_39_13]|uniref:DAGKc domain-containing protein n=1 Tax=Candidatus Kuenenbacteria bacterium RIFCSPHIGHO2_02_FULL_39_13 TaxID=1798561 RepID=A0A1F6FNZ7_9BACT|nr:MAG: hypothetical protein A3B87_02425 [Candidatus Kuenenbacteria bacterium RIFCSPHIGHO2_02_FULL_39_13]
MYYYIYDIFTASKKYQNQLLKIEGLLTEFGIAGKNFKLNVLKNLDDIIDQALANEVTNIIAIGNDQTMSKIANLIVGKNIVMGIIPVGEPNILASAFGIKSAEEAVAIVSARNVLKLDVGKINGEYFILSIESNDGNAVFDFKDYNIKALPSNKAMGVYNININKDEFQSDPGDGIMEAVFKPKKLSWFARLFRKNSLKESSGVSIFPVKKMTIQHKKKPINISIDRQRVLKTPLEIEVLPKKLTMIVGKRRVFK